jgi:hypothetical protein
MSEFLVKNLLGYMPLVLTNKLFKSPLGLFFECYGIARAVPVVINKIKIFIDFHIYTILEFDILIGYPLENLIQEKSSHKELDEKFGKTASAIPNLHSAIQMPKHNPNHNLVKEVKFISPFTSHPCEAELPSSLKRSRFSSKGKSTDTIYNVVDHESNSSHYQLSADIIVIHHRITSYKALQHWLPHLLHRLI